jgi:predicted GNAT family N-acyltransferase
MTANVFHPPAATWRSCRFDDLTPRELQNIYAARQQVFVVEQACIYLDADGHDEAAWHLAAGFRWPTPACSTPE